MQVPIYFDERVTRTKHDNVHYEARTRGTRFYIKKVLLKCRSWFFTLSNGSSSYAKYLKWKLNKRRVSYSVNSKSLKEIFSLKIISTFFFKVNNITTKDSHCYVKYHTFYKLFFLYTYIFHICYTFYSIPLINSINILNTTIERTIKIVPDKLMCTNLSPTT